MKTKISLSHKQITALEEGVKELTQFNDIEQTLSIHNNGEGKASWIEFDEPSINFLFWLGVQTGINIGTKTTYIKKSWTDDTGGGMMVDYVELHNGVILSITDESVQAYRNIEEVEDSADNFASMEIIPMPELSGEGVDTTIVDHMEKRERERQDEAVFLVRCNDGGGRRPQQLDIQHIRDNWDLAETSDDTVILGAYLQDAEIGDTWVNGTDELERIS